MLDFKPKVLFEEVEAARVFWWELKIEPIFAWLFSKSDVPFFWVDFDAQRSQRPKCNSLIEMFKKLFWIFDFSQLYYRSNSKLELLITCYLMRKASNLAFLTQIMEIMTLEIDLLTWLTWKRAMPWVYLVFILLRNGAKFLRELIVFARINRKPRLLWIDLRL